MMIKPSKQLYPKKVIAITFLMFFTLFIPENMSSRNQWNRNYIAIVSYTYNKSILLVFAVFYYSFTPYGEHAYLEYCDFSYSSDGKIYHKLVRCEVNDQPLSDSTIVNMKNKLPGANFEFVSTNFIPEVVTKWPGNGDITTKVKNSKLSRATLSLRWYPPPNYRVWSISATGKWHVNGIIYCDDFFDNIDYRVTPLNTVSAKVTDSNQTNVIDKDNVMKAFSENDGLVVEGAEHGANIQIYTTFGTLAKSVIADQDVIKIKLPTNQIYIVQAGQTRFKVAL